MYPLLDNFPIYDSISLTLWHPLSFTDEKMEAQSLGTQMSTQG